MKVLISLLLLTTFLGELVLDTSTSFVRSSSSRIKAFQQFDFDSESESTGSAPSKRVRELGEATPAHSALPVQPEVANFWPVIKSILGYSEITIPYLAPPVARIERPPIC